MADIESIITNAVADANPDTIESPDVDTDTGEDTLETPEEVTPESTDTSTDGEPDKEPEADAELNPATGKPKVEAAPVEKDELTKELEALGLKEPKEGERENRLPFKRVKKITENYGKKVAAKYEKELAPMRTEVATLRQTDQTFKNVNHLIETDPDLYIARLAAIHPDKYGKFLQGGKVESKETAKPAAAPSALGPRPPADHKFEDGSMGYTPDQHEKLLDWVAAKAKEEALTEARAEMDKRFKPLDDQRKSEEEFGQRVQKVKTEAQGIRDAYGADIVAKYESQIVEHMKKNPTMKATQAAREIILPALQADRNKMRTELLEESKSRKAAAKPAPTGGAQGKDDQPKTIEGVIAQAIAGIAR